MRISVLILFFIPFLANSQKVNFLTGNVREYSSKSRLAYQTPTNGYNINGLQSSYRIQKYIRAHLFKNNIFSEDFDGSKIAVFVHMGVNNKLDSIGYYIYKDIDRKAVLVQQIDSVLQGRLEALLIESIIEAAVYEDRPDRYGLLLTMVLLSKPAVSRDYKAFLAKLDKNEKRISLVGYNLDVLPKELKDFKKLEYLEISDNYLKKIKIRKRDFPSLKGISAKNNLLSKAKIRRSKSFVSVNFENNYLSEIPKGLKYVKEVNLANNTVKVLSPKSFRRVKRAELLNLYENNVKEITIGRAKMRNLKVIDLYYNRLRTIPEEIVRFKKLETLAISYNSIWRLPESLGTLKNLQTLYVHHNKLRTLPILPVQIRTLHLGYNLIEYYPASISNLKLVDDLDLSGNQMKDGAAEIKKLLSLKTLDVSANEMFESNSQKEDFGTYFKDRGVVVRY